MHHMGKYIHLSLEEREQVFLYLNQGKKLREIGRLLHRDHKTIAREIKRNREDTLSSTATLTYSPSVAQAKAGKRRSEAKVGIRKLDNPVLRSYVIRRLGQEWSPEQIAGRIQLKSPHLALSHETIYQFIYSKENRKLKLFELLRKHHSHRRLKYGRHCHHLKIPDRIWIESRPIAAQLRLEVGHWETDNMEGKRKTKGNVSALVDRKSLFTKLTKLISKEAVEKEAAILQAFKSWPNYLIKSITFDNGTENYTHHRVANQLGCETYFCHPYHSWEKGTVENTLGLVREYLPKGMDLSSVTQADLSWIADQLNHRPRKKLGYFTPAEVFERETGWGT